ncbi:ROK family protein [Clostridium formicaceticum]|uniref:Glucokinase n=1 Tax=Clostridium formicaceticum TaxID=1497 RepID=A0ABM6ESL7_9CLOT|nr:ROK family glucokinase [Clostridium formicaceticum]AOY76005.1 glucokinase [Clostridium formicaceticum]
MYYIGVDLGGTSIKVGIVSEKGDIIAKTSSTTPVEKGFEGVAAKIKELINKVMVESKIDKENIAAIGIGIPGACSKEGFVYFATNLFWKDVALGEKLQVLTGLKVYVENDATVAAVAEYIKGVTKGKKNSIFLTLGTGLGGGFIINHEIYSGSHGIGTEIGHVVIGENFYDCNCGNNGCFETFVSATAIIKYCKKLLAEEKDKGLIYNRINGNLDNLNAKIIFDCAKEGDHLALKVVDRMVHYLAIGLANLINLFDPDIIAIGGGVAEAGDVFLKKLKAEVKKYIYVKCMNVTEIALATLKNDAGMIGSGMYAKLNLEKE